MKKKFYWRKLDDHAKVLSLAANNKYMSVFRLSVVLTEKIDKETLQQALELALEKYKAFKVKMSKGLFWYYFEENEKKPVVNVENDYPFKKLNSRDNNDYLFKVTYFNNKINIDFYHVLTDGNAGGEFLKEIVYRYLELKHPDEFEKTLLEQQEILQDSENAYKKGYRKHLKKGSKSKKAYMLQGEELDRGIVSINHFNINLKEMKQCTNINECSLSMYLVAMVAYSIYETNYKMHSGKKPINICVPINLKKYITTETLSNFFSYMVICLNLRKNKIYTLDNILSMVKREFNKKLKLEKILGTISADAGTTNNIFVRIVPLVIKKIAVSIGSFDVKRHFTLTFSNIGKIEVEEKYKKYIENFFVILSPDWAEKNRCGVCSYEDNLVVSFSTILKDNLIESKFKELLVRNNIKFNIEGNGVNNVSE
ncbi:MAG: hypothetical protein IJ272_09100 [Clostridia bacterium]|nr:hypothetical protein [Clostridia bacterium]